MDLEHRVFFLRVTFHSLVPQGEVGQWHKIESQIFLFLFFFFQDKHKYIDYFLGSRFCHDHALKGDYW